MLSAPEADLISQRIADQRSYVVTQYRQVAGAMGRMWKAISLRTSMESWRQNDGYYGTGSCRDVDKPLSEEVKV